MSWLFENVRSLTLLSVRRETTDIEINIEITSLVNHGNQVKDIVSDKICYTYGRFKVFN